MGYKLIVEFATVDDLEDFVAQVADGGAVGPYVILSTEAYKENTVVNSIAGSMNSGIQCGNVYGGIVQDGIRRPHP